MTVTAAAFTSTPKRLVMLLTQDGAAGSTLALTNAVLQAACKPGPLKNALNAIYVTDGTSIQSAMRTVFGGKDIEVRINPRAQIATASLTEDGQWFTDVATDAVSTTKPKIDVGAPLSTGTSTTAYIVVEYVNSPNR